MIIRLIKIYLIVISSVGLFACTSAPTVQLPELPDTMHASIEKYSEDYKLHPNNPASAARLGDIYYQAYQQTQNTAYRQLALETYAKFSKLAPENNPVKITMYSMLMEKAVSGDEDAQYEVNRFYAQYPVLKESGSAPPSYIQAVQLLKQNNSNNESNLINALKISISDAPSFYGAYLYLFRVHSAAERYRLAKAILVRGIQAANHPFLHRELYYYTVDRGNTEHTGSCYVDLRDSYIEAISSAKQWARLLPKDPQAHAALSQSYSYLGRPRLMLDSSKRATKLQPNLKYAVDTADAYLALGQTSKAKDILLPLLSAKDSTLARESYSEWAFGTESWPEYIAQIELLISNGDTSPYNFFRLAKVYNHIGEPEKAKKALEKSIKPANLSEWESKLYAYYLGNISDNSLVGSAKNICETTEAQFAVGITAYFEADKAKAVQFFKKVKINNLTKYREHISAVNLLKRLE